MARNASGTYTLPNVAVVTGTTITATDENTTRNDIATEMTDSLSRSGKGGMLSGKQLILDVGAVGAPAIAFLTDTGSGLYRIGSNDIGFAINGVKVMEWTASATTIVQPTTISGTLTSTGAFTASSTANVVGNFSVATNKFNVTAASGNTTVAGTLVVSLPTTLTGSANIAPLILTPQAVPAALTNGQVWVDSGTNRFDVRINGATQTMLTSPILRTDLPSVGQQVSSSCGSFSSSSVGETDVTNLTVTITTGGRPVILAVQPDGTANSAEFVGSASTASLFIDRAGANIAKWSATKLNTGNLSAPPTGFMYIDAVGAGTYTYKVRVTPNGSALLVSNFILVAYEL